jgi:D-sedoheptulose 7-phosphate isomerase
LKEKILEELKESIKLKEDVINKLIPDIEKSAKIIIKSLKKGGKIILFGNGGSAADAQHIAAELVGRFKKERKSLPAIALSTNTSIITALSNDYNFKIIFSRQIESMCSKDDVAIGISTSGNSENVLEGIKTAKKIGAKTIGFSGSGGKLKEISDICICVPSNNTPRIQEIHITIGHILCKLIEDELFS